MNANRLAVLLSTLVYPGAGQLIQKRWAAGAVFGIAATLSLVFFLAYATVILREYYRFAFEFEAREMPPLPLMRMMIAFLTTLLIYIAGIMDTVRANRKRN
ncbi:MAG TPA: hypothetical protein PKM67_03815 [Kiritimatiellia bacterium]|nr:hypothetical protein [Kiritimatiellia bacterium]HNS80564.1 hypothetical protein [Kiritimatiellia bacterium]